MSVSTLMNAARAAWDRAASLWRQAPIDSPESLKEFVATRAAFVAQKSAVDYCRGKTGLMSRALFEEEVFRNALDVCRWESFAATLGDILILTEGFLRTAVPRIAHPQQKDRDQLQRVGAALAGFYPAILASYPLPRHRTEKGWADAEAEFAIRFAAARAAPPGEPTQVAFHSAMRMFETLPIHSSMRKFDEEIVHGAVRFRMVAAYQELTRRANPEKLVAALAARG